MLQPIFLFSTGAAFELSSNCIAGVARPVMRGRASNEGLCLKISLIRTNTKNKEEQRIHPWVNLGVTWSPAPELSESCGEKRSCDPPSSS